MCRHFADFGTGNKDYTLVNKCLARAAFGRLNGPLWLCWPSTSVFFTGSVRANCREESRAWIELLEAGNVEDWTALSFAWSSSSFTWRSPLFAWLTETAVELFIRGITFLVKPGPKLLKISKASPAAGQAVDSSSSMWPRDKMAEWKVHRGYVITCCILIRKKIKIPTRNQKIKYVINVWGI